MGLQHKEENVIRPLEKTNSSKEEAITTQIKFSTFTEHETTKYTASLQMLIVKVPMKIKPKVPEKVMPKPKRKYPRRLNFPNFGPMRSYLGLG